MKNGKISTLLEFPLSVKIRSELFLRPGIRRERGSMLALSIALLLGFVLLLAFFGLRFTRMLGSHQEQKTAIEAAALAAANSISRIVVLDPVLGYVGLSDGAPRGKRTAAQDGFGLQVRGINMSAP